MKLRWADPGGGAMVVWFRLISLLICGLLGVKCSSSCWIGFECGDDVSLFHLRIFLLSSDIVASSFDLDSKKRLSSYLPFVNSPACQLGTGDLYHMVHRYIPYAHDSLSPVPQTTYSDNDEQQATTSTVASYLESPTAQNRVQKN